MHIERSTSKIPQISQTIGPSERKKSREAKEIEEFLINLTKQFLSFCTKQGPNTGMNKEATKKHEYDRKAFYDQCNHRWQVFCHKKKWKFHEMNKKGFEECVFANMNKDTRRAGITTDGRIVR